MRISTKVGFFHSGGNISHSLEPQVLLSAIHQFSNDLGRTPNLIFLHNPERTLSLLGDDQAGRTLAKAVECLQQAVDEGACDSWGISCWEPNHLLRSVKNTSLPVKPAVLMVRSGLLVKVSDILQAEQLQLVLNPSMMWGMSPFGGNNPLELFGKVDLSAFLTPSSRSALASHAAVALRIAFCLPNVSHIAISTNSCSHLDDLVSGLSLMIDPNQITKYRLLLSSTNKSSDSKRTAD
jgi:pyridoxine 4-dehydrogenase